LIGAAENFFKNIRGCGKKRGRKRKLSSPQELMSKNQAGLTIAPERMQRVQTRMRAVRPVSVTVLTFCRLGSQRRLFLLWACLTLLPVAGPFPQISHTRAMIYSPYKGSSYISAKSNKSALSFELFCSFIFYEPDIFTSACKKKQALFP